MNCLLIIFKSGKELRLEGAIGNELMIILYDAFDQGSKLKVTNLCIDFSEVVYCCLEVKEPKVELVE